MKIFLLLLALLGTSQIRQVNYPIIGQTTLGSYPDVPNSTLTPGAVRTTDRDSIINTRTGTIRDVPESEKAAVWAAYQKAYPGVFGDKTHWKDVEYDHATSIELGGSNDPKNIWPEGLHINKNGLDVGAKTKDILENKLHALIVKGTLTPVQAQTAIMQNWEVAYIKYVGPFPKYVAK